MDSEKWNTIFPQMGTEKTVWIGPSIPMLTVLTALLNVCALVSLPSRESTCILNFYLSFEFFIYLSWKLFILYWDIA